MRESNFAFPAQNRACVCISSQLYDRRALDTTSSLPLFNSLTHLVYLTSTSPRIRDIMTLDGGLERLVRILHDFCLCPPPPENPTLLYGLSPSNARPPKLVPTLNPQVFDKHAAYRFSLALQCVVNIGVRGSESIRSRVVQAGTLDVVGCILEAWLANKGFAVGPSTSATGIPRETRDQRLARRQAQAQAERLVRQREEAAELSRALERQIQVDSLIRVEDATTPSGGEVFVQRPDELMDAAQVLDDHNQFVRIVDSGPTSPSPSNDTDGDIDTSADTSINATPIGSGTPTGVVSVPGRDRSGTVIARTHWDEPTTATIPRHRTHHHHHHPRQQNASPSPSPDTSRPDTETEDDGDADGDGDVDMDRGRVMDENSPSPERRAHISIAHPRRVVGIVSDDPAAVPIQVNADAHIIINDAEGGVVGGDGVGIEEGIVSLEPNDDFAMGAPPGAPGAIDEGTTPRNLNMNVNIRNVDENRRNRNAPDVTPRAGTMSLPPPTIPEVLNARALAVREGGVGAITPRNGVQRSRTITAADGGNGTGAHNSLGRTSSNSNGHHHRDSDSGPYRDEDVLLSLQLLAYLSKYPHVRQAFYKPRVTFHPASATLPGVRHHHPHTSTQQQQPAPGPSNFANSNPTARNVNSILQGVKDPNSFFKSFATSGTRGKEKEREKPTYALSTPASGVGAVPVATRQTNVFSLVERFTFRPSSTETDLPNPPPKLPPEIQYWAGVIMRNACRKDDSRGGIRQCANMLCGRWESYPREFAKCRRCRKAKYCGKECQSTAWSEGHRFWCSAKDGDDEAAPDPHHGAPHHGGAGEHGGAVEVVTDDTGAGTVVVTATAGGTITNRAERRAERERRTLAHIAAATAADGTHVPNPRHGHRGMLSATRAQVGANTNVIFGADSRTNQVVPSQPRIPAFTLRAFGRAGVAANPNGGESVLDALLGPHPHTEQGVRRRAETVTGVIGLGAAGRADPENTVLSRVRPTAERFFTPAADTAAVVREETSPRGAESLLRALGGEHDMVLG